MPAMALVDRNMPAARHYLEKIAFLRLH